MFHKKEKRHILQGESKKQKDCLSCRKLVKMKTNFQLCGVWAMSILLVPPGAPYLPIRHCWYKASTCCIISRHPLPDITSEFWQERIAPANLFVLLNCFMKFAANEFLVDKNCMAFLMHIPGKVLLAMLFILLVLLPLFLLPFLCPLFLFS